MATYKKTGYEDQGSDVTEKEKLLMKTDFVKDTAAGAATTQNAGYSDYKPSDAVTQAQELLKQQLAQKPGAYQSPWQTQLNDIIQQILNREKFSYDLNGDALYQQYKDQHMTQGKMAMMDTMGQAQAMTGGYGNSYAQSVGQQAYQGHLQKLNEKIPELYQLALSKYQMAGDAMYDQAALMAQQEELDYGRYRDQVSDYYTELGRLTEDARYQEEQDYGRYRDSVSDEQWQAEFDEAKRQYDQNYALKTSGGSSTGSTPTPAAKPTPATPATPASDPTKPKYDTDYSNHGYSADVIMRVQDFLGVPLNGLWGPDAAKKAAAMGYNSLEEVVEAMNNRSTGAGSTGITGFTGSSYAEAVAYMKANGVPNAEASNAMTQNEWNRRKDAYNRSGVGGAEVKNYNSYKEYLADYVAYRTGK